MKGTDKIRSQAGHLLSLINGILEITKIESGTAALQTEFVSLSDFMSDCQSDYMSPLDKDLHLEWDFPSDLPVILSDRMRLRQVLTNLINNAIKFTEQGTVYIAARTRDEGETFEIRVADTGPGIPEDRLERIFEKFHQIDSATTRNFSGAGLGLYIVKTFVELLDGSISVESKIGAGSVFTVRLPIKVEQTAAAVQESPPARPGYMN
jgi:signal transduction histidine kinase